MKRIVPILLVTLWALSACVQSIPSASTAPPANAIQTAVVQTLTAQPTSPSASPTALVPTSTAVPPSPTPVPPTATPVTPTPTATPTTTPSQVQPAQGYGVITQTPEQFIRYYYAQIDFNNLALTWSLLDANFRYIMNGPSTGGYAGYVYFWNTVHNVQVENVYVQSQNGPYAVVTVTAQYHWNTGDLTYSTDTFNLIYSYSRGTWLFDSPAQVYYPPVYVPPVLLGESPSQFIYYYFSQINISNYPLTWSLLSTNFQNNNNGASQGGYAGYVGYWNTIYQVSVQSVTVLSLSSYTATVSVYAIYTLNSGVVAPYSVTYNLIYDYTRGTWLFDS